MRPERITHGPWIGLDFNPLTDIARTAPLCPDGWVKLVRAHGAEIEAYHRARDLPTVGDVGYW